MPSEKIHETALGLIDVLETLLEREARGPSLIAHMRRLVELATEHLVNDGLGRHNLGIARAGQLTKEAVETVANLLLGGLWERGQVLGAAALEPGGGDGQELVVEARGAGSEER